MITSLYIALGVTLLLVVVHQLNKRFNINTNKDFLTQVDFVRMYMQDDTESEFFNKSTEDAVEHGQDIMYSAAKDFHEAMHRAVRDQEPLKPGDMTLANNAIRIIKAAEALVFISENGPIETDNSSE